MNENRVSGGLNARLGRRAQGLVVGAFGLVLLAGVVAQAPLPADLRVLAPSGFFALYAENRARGIPNYITEDFLATGYLMVLDEAVTDFERNTASPALDELVRGLAEVIDGPSEPHRTARAFLAVLEALLRGVEQSSEDDLVNRELRAVLAADGIGGSELLRQSLDYSQFRVRGKYTRDETLARYFRAVRYAGVALFPLQASRATGVSEEGADILTGAALLMSRAVDEDGRLGELYRKATAPQDYLFGRTDAMTAPQYARVAARNGFGVEPGSPQLRELRQVLLAEGVRPQVLGGAVETALLEPGVSAADALAGWQLLPARLTGESAAFQELVHDRVGPYRGRGEPFTVGVAGGELVKAFPTMWELGALLGSPSARQRLDKEGDTQYAGYKRAYQRAGKAWASGATGLPADHFALLSAWLRGSGRRADPERRLNTALGFWTLQRHGAAAYAKQSYTVATRSAPPERRSAWLEPAPRFYGDLAAAARSVTGHLESGRLAAYADLAERCAEISQRELAGRRLGADEVEFLNGLDRALRALTEREDGPVTIDFHTDVNSGLVVQAAIGRPQVVDTDAGGGSRGGLFSVHQFKQTLRERLTDADWADRVATGELKPLITANWPAAGGAQPKQRERQ